MLIILFDWQDKIGNSRGQIGKDIHSYSSCLYSKFKVQRYFFEHLPLIHAGKVSQFDPLIFSKQNAFAVVKE